MKLKEIPGALLNQLLLEAIPVGQLLETECERRPVVVSLTTIPTRLSYVHITIRSLLRQTVLPEKIILWLNAELRHSVPKKLKRLQSELFEIRYSNLTCPHRKLIHSLDAFPGSVIVTCDDDAMYERTWLENLFQEHLLYPEQIITNRGHLITYDKEGNTLPYLEWQKIRRNGHSSPALMPAGYGGVLYPAGCFMDEVTNQELFLKLAPTADDLWFKAMSYLKGTLCRCSMNPGKKPVTILGTQSFRLGHTNIHLDQNREQWNALLKHFNFTTPQPELVQDNTTRV
ncbi:hypothetical protein SAMN02745866_02564 [Alteromonadaceae bacterium Bs31]|nr:hypothetical protein SAMN02745866_02564 [Alteromonadaceae bacterium Bs31]